MSHYKDRRTLKSFEPQSLRTPEYSSFTLLFWTYQKLYSLIGVAPDTFIPFLPTLRVDSQIPMFLNIVCRWM